MSTFLNTRSKIPIRMVPLRREQQQQLPVLLFFVMLKVKLNEIVMSDDAMLLRYFLNWRLSLKSHLIYIESGAPLEIPFKLVGTGNT